uniref:Protein TIME FOR COFFEE n=1 Tax=Leersia perrieri TaxID=77586 RepID=A0A0D9X0K6_9ORYZ
MDRIREGSRRAGVSGGGSGGPPPPRRRLRSNGGGSGGVVGVGPRDSPRSERRRGERLMLNGGGGRDDGDETSDESLGGGGHHHNSSSSSGGGGGGGGGYHNHHHHGGGGGGQPQMQRKGGSNPKSPIVWKAADEMIGVPVPRKARSASTKRSSHEWSVPGGGSSGGGGSGSGVGDTSQIQRPSSRPISPASGSTTGPARKKLKHLGGSGTSGGSGQAPKQRPTPASAPSTAPPQPPPPKITKSPSFIQEEIEVAEVLFGLTRQQFIPPKPVESNHKLEARDASEAKSGNSSPAPSSSVVRPSDSTSLATIAPKRKRPRLVKYDDDARPASPAKPELAEPSSRPETLASSRSEAKASVSAATDSGITTATAGAQHESSREPEKREDHRSRDLKLRPGESDRRDHRPESRTEQPPSSNKPDGESAAVASEARNGEATAATKIELASDGARQEKFCIDLMAPPPGKLSPDRDGASDPDVDKKGLDSGMDMVGRGNSEKKDVERPRRGLEINLEDDKMVQRMPADELASKKLTLQLDLEKPSLGDEKSPSERRPQPALQQQQQKTAKNEPKHEKSAMPAVTPPMPIPVGNWPMNFPPFGYLSPVPALSAAGLHPMDVKPGSSAGLQPLHPPPVRPKRCATHCFIAKQIEYNKQFQKMNFWPPVAAAAAAAASRSAAPFFGPRPFNMGVVPPAEAASLLVNPMQGSYPVRAHAPLQEAKPPSMATSPFQGSLSKDKAAMNNAAVAESSQRKQPQAHEAQQSSPVPNMLQGPAFIFPFNQQQAAAVAAANAASRVGDTKPSGGSNAMPPSAAAHASPANPGAAAMNLSFANLPPADAQFLAILQNGYPFQVAAHAGGAPAYRGMAPPGPAVPFFNGHVYSSHMLHPSQQQGASPQNLQKAPMSNMSTSSQKHQPQQSQGLLGYAPNANAAGAANNSQSYSSGNPRPVLLTGLAHRQDSEKNVQDGAAGDDKSSHPQKGGYDHNYAVPVHLPNFALMPPTSAGGGGQSDKKSSDHHMQQLPPASRGQGVRIDLASSQPFVMPFGSVGAPGSAPGGLDFSQLAQNHALFQSHQEAGRHSYPQFNFAAPQSVQAGQHKPQHQATGEAKSVAGDSSTHNTVDSERKKSTAAKYPGDSQQHSLSFSRQDSKSYVPPFLSGGTNESSSRTLSLIGSEPSNTFSLGGKSANASTPAATSAAAPSPSSIPQQQQQQHFLQLQKHQMLPHHQLNSRPRSAAPSNAGGYSDRLNISSYHGVMYASSAAQGGVPSQSPQLKPSSARATGAPSGAASPGAPPSNLIVMKNSGFHQQQAKAPLQPLSTTNPQAQSSSKIGPSVNNISTGGGDLSRSSNAPVASGSPSNSVSKSAGGSPPASGSAKGVPPAVQLPSPQQQSAKNPVSTSGAKPNSTNHYSGMPMPSILGQQPNAPASNSGSKQQSHITSVKQQPFTQGHFFISNAYTPQGPGAAGGVPLGLYQKRSADKTQQQAPHQQSAMSGLSTMLSLCFYFHVNLHNCNVS